MVRLACLPHSILAPTQLFFFAWAASTFVSSSLLCLAILSSSFLLYAPLLSFSLSSKKNCLLLIFSPSFYWGSFYFYLFPSGLGNYLCGLLILWVILVLPPFRHQRLGVYGFRIIIVTYNSSPSLAAWPRAPWPAQSRGHRGKPPVVDNATPKHAFPSEEFSASDCWRHGERWLWRGTNQFFAAAKGRLLYLLKKNPDAQLGWRPIRWLVSWSGRLEALHAGAGHTRVLRWTGMEKFRPARSLSRHIQAARQP